jgi:hypothetical protein
MESRLLHAGHNTVALRAEYQIAGYLVTPIHRLPIELLELIFSLIPDEQNQKIETLERTCHEWKEIVSSLWRPLKLATWTSLEKVQPVLNRGYGLLSVTVDPAIDAMDRPIDSLETERYAALVLAMSTGISRWRTLDILSLPDPKQIDSMLGEHSHTIHPIGMNHLRYLNIPIRHESSRLLDLLLPSIGATTSVSFTEMHLCSTQAMLYLAQSHCAKVFTHLISFKCLLPRTDDVIDILPHFEQLEILDVSGLRFPTYGADVELPLAKTLREMSLRGVPIGWMHNREFLRLESCRIVSPPGLDVVPMTRVPLCTKLHFESPRLDALRKFHIPPICVLTLRSPQWNKSRGNDQLSRLWGAVPNEGLLRPVSFHLQLACSSEQLVWALCFMPELKELVLELDRPNALGRHFFVQLLPPSSRLTWRHKRAPIQLQACPLLEVLHLKYHRWFRPGESNEMPALLAMAHFDERTPKLKIWVERGITGEDKVQVDGAQISEPILHSLQLVNGGQPPGPVLQEIIDASLATFNPMDIRFYHPETLTLFSPSTYSCLFRYLQIFALYTEIDQRVLFEALAHFEHLEELDVTRLTPSSSLPHLPLFRTLKKLQLGMTSLLWMGGGTFLKLEYLEIGEVIEESDGQLRPIQIPVCKTASFSQLASPKLLSAFQMPHLLHLDVHSPTGPSEGLRFSSTQQFGVPTATLDFVNSAGLQDVLSLQPMLEVLEVRSIWACGGFQEFFDILMGPHKVRGLDSLEGHDMWTPKERLLPKLKVLKLQLQMQLGLNQELSLLQVLLRLWEQAKEVLEKKKDGGEGLNRVLMRLEAQMHEVEQMIVPESLRTKAQQMQEWEVGMASEVLMESLYEWEQTLLREQEKVLLPVLVQELEQKLKLVSI